MEAHRRDILNALTVDVEDYFHVAAFKDVVRPADWDSFASRVEDNTARILDMLGRHGLSATFFILGWEAERRPGLVRRIAANGHEVACHGHDHQLIYQIGLDAFREDVLRSKKTLEDLTGEPVLGYRAPSYSITPKSLWALDVLAEAGFAYDSSIVPARHDLYGLPGAPRFPYRVSTASGELVEFPPTTMRPGFGPFKATLPVGGGGYLRLYPLALTHWGLSDCNRTHGQPFSVYVHPWELDPAQPRVACPPRSRFRHYLNLHKTSSRLESLLRKFRFGPMGKVIESLPHCPAFAARDGNLKEAAA